MRRHRILLALCLASTLSLHAQSWSRDTDAQSRGLTYTTTATLLGVSTPLVVRFFWNPEITESTTGAVGFTMEIRKAELIKAFHFDDFEGPDSPASQKKLLKAEIVRGGKADRIFRTAPAGWYSVRGGFGLEVSGTIDDGRSTAKKLVYALSDGADSLRVTVSDYRDRDVNLEITIPLKDRGDDFRWLVRR